MPRPRDAVAEGRIVAYVFDNPAECSGPPHLLGPVGFGRSGGGTSGLLMTPLPTGHLSLSKTGTGDACVVLFADVGLG